MWQGCAKGTETRAMPRKRSPKEANAVSNGKKICHASNAESSKTFQVEAEKENPAWAAGASKTQQHTAGSKYLVNRYLSM